MASPHRLLMRVSPERSAVRRVLWAFVCVASVVLASCQYPSAYPQSYGYGYGQAGASPQTYAPYQNTQPGYYGAPLVQSASQKAAAWSQRMQSQNPVYPTVNAANPPARGRRIVPNASTANPGVLGIPPQPTAASTWQGAPTYPPYNPAQPYPQTAAPATGGYQYGAQAPVPGYGSPQAGAGYPSAANTGYPPPANFPAPTNYSAGNAGSTYTIQKGDTLSGIAVRKQVGLDTLLQVNNLSRSSIIQPGQTINIPGR